MMMLLLHLPLAPSLSRLAGGFKRTNPLRVGKWEVKFNLKQAVCGWRMEIMCVKSSSVGGGGVEALNDGKLYANQVVGGRLRDQAGGLLSRKGEIHLRFAILYLIIFKQPTR